VILYLKPGRDADEVGP